jgi:hypothetical protein
VHGEGGQATIEWVALVLLAALVLGAAAAFAGRGADPGVGVAVAERITGAVRGVGQEPRRREPKARPAPPAGDATPPSSPRPSPLAALTRAFGLAGSVAEIGGVAKHGWIVCLGYERWRHEQEDPVEPTETLPLDDALSMVNTCFNPHGYLLDD